jgi:hypothetical protein
LLANGGSIAAYAKAVIFVVVPEAGHGEAVRYSDYVCDRFWISGSPALQALWNDEA